MTEHSLTVSQYYRRLLSKQFGHTSLSFGGVIEVNNGFIISRDRGEWGGMVLFASGDCPVSELEKIYSPCAELFRPEKKSLYQSLMESLTEKERPCYKISEHQIKGFVRTKIGILGFGGLSHLSRNKGYLVKFFYSWGSWRDSQIKNFKSAVYGCKEIENGLKIRLQNNEWVDFHF